MKCPSCEFEIPAVIEATVKHCPSCGIALRKKKVADDDDDDEGTLLRKLVREEVGAGLKAFFDGVGFGDVTEIFGRKKKVKK